MNKLKNHIILMLTTIIALVSCNTKSDGNENNTKVNEYEVLKQELKKSEEKDEEIIEKYSSYITINDGKYVFSANEENEETEFIKSNIETINSFVETGEAYINENGVNFYCQEEMVVTQFGFTNLNWHWYGLI